VSIRVYICPVVGSGVKADSYRSKAWDIPGAETRSWLPSKLDGTPGSTWTLTVAKADDFSAFDADPTFDDLFGGDLPNTVQTRNDLLAFLRGRTVSDVPVVRRNKITAVLDKYLVRRDDFVGATPLWKVMQRVVATLDDQDDHYGSGFGFGD
jgi:hypothetical protein